MDADAPITGAPMRAPNFAEFDLSRIDQLAGELDTLKSLIWVAVDLVSAGGPHGENLLHAALHQYDLIDDRLQAIHSDLMPIHKEARHA
ncbi:hypothetical protein ABIC16_000266 [Sphingomonas sp. PvP055]|uniref:hypothetical protein n=1 Tax=Sphingomonas sp. PvP055 TaxID=3156391 RepID=UPI003397048D